jgi:HAE1 family hydrophobic/amphiphilic exporter-1
LRKQRSLIAAIGEGEVRSDPISLMLKDWADRKSQDESYAATRAHISNDLLPAGVSIAFSPPAIPGVGTSGGVTFILEDRAGHDVKFLANNTNAFMQAARKRPEPASVFTTMLPSAPQPM